VNVQALKPSEDINTFLDYLYLPEDTGYVYAPTKTVADGKFTQHYFQWPQDRHKLVEWVLTTTPTAEVYIAPALFSEPSAQKSSFKSTNVLWTEFDGNYPASFGDVPQPTFRVQSSDAGHQHAYWRLDEPITSYQTVEAYNRTLAYGLQADASAWDCNQVLRPPGTRNHKRDTFTAISYASDLHLPLGLFVPTEAVGEVTEFDLTVIPDIQDIIYKYEFPVAVSSLLRTRDLAVGERSTGLMKLGFYCAEMGMSDAEIFSVIRNADDRWGKFAGRTDRDQRLLDLIGRVRIKYPVTEFQTDVIPVYGFQSFMEHEIQVEWVIPELLQEQGYLLLTGPSGVGKTQWSLRWAIHLALGRDYLGFSINKPRKIGFLSLEMAHADLKYFLAIMAKDYSDEDKALLETNLILVPYGEPIYFDNKEGQQQVIDIIEATGVEGVFIDSTGSTTSGGLSNEDTVKRIMDFNDSLRKRMGVFTWYIHHMRKASGDNKKPNKLSDVYGNQYLVNRATTVMCLWPNHSKIDVLPLKIRLGPQGVPWSIARVGNLSFERTSSVNILTSADDESTYEPPGKDFGHNFGDV
jgi:AAA domain/RepB DNA-primase from phage plasmid